MVLVNALRTIKKQLLLGDRKKELAVGNKLVIITPPFVEQLWSFSIVW